MGHPDIKNQTPFAFETLFLSDEGGRPLLVPLVKATYSLAAGGVLTLAEKQIPPNLQGEYHGPPETSSYKYEPEVAFFKPATDVVLIGHAYAPRKSTTTIDVTLEVGPIRKSVRVTGDRYWARSFGRTITTSPQPFERMPLVYERAFGGWDRSHPDPSKHAYEPRNPVGTGFRSKQGQFEDGIRLPNLEDPSHPLKSYGDTTPPTGFGFISPHWKPRADYAGTYDEVWTKERMPLLPLDFDRRFMNAAPPDQVVPGYLKGNEPVRITNASPFGQLVFKLPGMPPPECSVSLHDGSKQCLQTRLDTVIINTDENLLFLMWRTSLVLATGPHDVAALEVRADGIPLAAVS